MSVIVRADVERVGSGDERHSPKICNCIRRAASISNRADSMIGRVGANTGAVVDEQVIYIIVGVDCNLLAGDGEGTVRVNQVVISKKIDTNN